VLRYKKTFGAKIKNSFKKVLKKDQVRGMFIYPPLFSFVIFYWKFFSSLPPSQTAKWPKSEPAP
jgi:hypothetical protein